MKHYSFKYENINTDAEFQAFGSTIDDIGFVNLKIKNEITIPFYNKYWAYLFFKQKVNLVIDKNKVVEVDFFLEFNNDLTEGFKAGIQEFKEYSNNKFTEIKSMVIKYSEGNEIIRSVKSKLTDIHYGITKDKVYDFGFHTGQYYSFLKFKNENSNLFEDIIKTISTPRKTRKKRRPENLESFFREQYEEFKRHNNKYTNRKFARYLITKTTNSKSCIGLSINDPKIFSWIKNSSETNIANVFSEFEIA